MKDYFAILGLSAHATTTQIKAAYRRLAKIYHPDGHHPDRSAMRFIEVNEAYEFLSDSTRKREYGRRAQFASAQASARREAIYREWINEQQNKTRRRAKENAEQSFDAFVESPIFKAAMVLHGAYDYIFAGIGVLIIVAPLMAYYEANTNNEINDLYWWDCVIPMVLGMAFTYGIYYFLFKNKIDAN